MLDSELLLCFADRFYGYGDLTAPIWFIGMEEGGGGEENIRKRLETWDARGRKQLEDIAGYHEAMTAEDLTRRKRVRIQPTWEKLIYFQMAAEAGTPTREGVRAFQKFILGREASATCLLELMPLPKKTAGSWPYGTWTDVPELWSRSLYFAHFAVKRATALRQLIEDHSPKVVVFYGKSAEFSCHWPWIAGVKLSDWEDADKWHVTERGGVHYMIAPHPVSHGSRNEVWSDMGARVSGRVEVKRPPIFNA
ncbi:hypothetical protein [Roseovarius nitratireducens]|uniref:hypothetical protein n=1 Tax=Roseovarius nitratireducens TaxID=2044597 RepID=UPI000CE18235|nr:hypothetical protein [Roseovarius nitratireducens]